MAQVAVAITITVPTVIWVSYVVELVRQTRIDHWIDEPIVHLIAVIAFLLTPLWLLKRALRAVLGAFHKRTSDRRLLRGATALEAAAADGAGDGQVARGSITSAPAETVPVMLRVADRKPPMGVLPREIRVSAQPFVVEGRGGPWLVDSAYIELFDKTPSKDGRAAVIGELVVTLGEEVVMLAESQDEVQAPTWFSGAVGLSGYRDRRIRRLLGTAEAPIRIWRIPRYGASEDVLAG